MKLPRCPRCNARIMQKSGDGKLRLRTKLMAFSSNGTEAICRQCGHGVPIDIELGAELRKAMNAEPRLIVRKGIDVRNAIS